MKLFQLTAYALLFMLCSNVNLTAKQSKSVLENYFPESYVQELLEESDIPEEKWQTVITKLRTKTKIMVEESGIMDVISTHNPAQINRKLKKVENAVKKAFTKAQLISEENLPVVKEKLKNTEKKLKKMMAEREGEVSESQELHNASAALKRAEKNIQAFIKHFVKEELTALSD